MESTIVFSLPPGNLRLGLIEAKGIKVAASDDSYRRTIADEISHILKPDFIFPDHMQKGIRSLLKSYGFHPSGRNRPASEFLVKDLQGRGTFNAINNVVDINNHISLIHNLPISVFDLAKSGLNFCVRLGMPGETYIFNREGQELALKNLVLIARAESTKDAIGSPIKDSHATKITSETTDILVVVYTSSNISTKDQLFVVLDRYTKLLQTEAKAQTTEVEILDSP